MLAQEFSPYWRSEKGVPGVGRLQSIDAQVDNDNVICRKDELGRGKRRAICGMLQTLAYDGLDLVAVLTKTVGPSRTGTSIRVKVRK